MSQLHPLAGESLKIILIILLGWTSFSFADTTTKWLSQHVENFEPAVLLTFSGAFGATLLASWILFKKGWKGFLSPKWKWLIARGICIAVTATSVVNAISHIPLADLYGITFSAPFISVCLAYVLLKEQVGWHRWLAVIIGFIGVFILVGPQFNKMNVGIIFAISAALSIAAGTIVIRKVGNKEYLPLFVLYPFIGIFLTNAPLAIGHFNLPSLPVLGGFAASSLFVMGGQMFTTYAISHAKSTASVAPFVYVQVIWGTIFGFFLFGDLPTLTTIIGLIMIVGAGIYMIYREQQLRKIKSIH